jgi:uncharacterized glyoxalase superfamily metalloenzyme YdcJ
LRIEYLIFRVLPMTRTLFRTSGFRSFARTFSFPSSDWLTRLSLARAIRRAVAARGISLETESRVSGKHTLRAQDAGCADEDRVFEYPSFSDVWKDAQRSRTAFARAYLEALVRQRRARIRQALAQSDLGIAPRAGRNAGSPDAP